MADLTQISSILQMNSIFFEDFSYCRKSSSNSENEGKIDLKVVGPIQNDNGFAMILKAHVQAGNTYQIDISLRGNFSIENGTSEDTERLKTNAVAIMFPYLRSQLTLLTTQPGISPVVLPPINVNMLMRKRDDD